MKNRAMLFVLGAIVLACFLSLGRGKFGRSAPLSSGLPVAVLAPPSPPASPNHGTGGAKIPPRTQNESSPATSLARRIDQARTTLAKRSAMSGKSSVEVHHTPIEVDRSASDIGGIAELLNEHPELIPQALPFFLECALDTYGVNAIRALCAYRLDVYRAHWDRRLTDEAKRIPVEIMRLKNQLSE